VIRNIAVFFLKATIKNCGKVNQARRFCEIFLPSFCQAAANPEICAVKNKFQAGSAAQIQAEWRSPEQIDCSPILLHL